MTANTDAELRKRKFPHSTHGETRHKPHSTVGRSVGQYKRKSQKKVIDIGPRWEHVPYTPLTAEQYDAIDWEWVFSVGVE